MVDGGNVPFEDLELRIDDARVVSLVFGISLYTDKPFSSIRQSILDASDLFFSHCPQEQIKFYATETMKKHRPVTKKTFGMLKTWLAPDAPPREYVALELKDGDAFNWAPKHKLEFFGGEEGSTAFSKKNANLLRMAFPPEWGTERQQELYDLTCRLCTLLPAQSCQAGYAFECSPYWLKQGQNHAWSKSMRHRGINIHVTSKDIIATGQDGIRGVNWLTYICEDFAERIGGRTAAENAASEDVEVLPLGTGVLFKAGESPQIGDQNRRDFLPQYKEVFSILAPLTEEPIERSPTFTLLDREGRAEKTGQWLGRFADD